MSKEAIDIKARIILGKMSGVAPMNIAVGNEGSNYKFTPVFEEVADAHFRLLPNSGNWEIRVRDHLLMFPAGFVTQGYTHVAIEIPGCWASKRISWSNERAVALHPVILNMYYVIKDFPC